MDIQMVDLRGQYLRIKNEIDEALAAVIDSTAFIGGPALGEFECDLAGYMEVPYVRGVANGTDALQIAMMALGIGPGDEVITSSFTFVATGEAAALLGAVPVFADIEPGTFNIDPAAIEALITKRTRAIVPVHLFGQPADMDPILDIGRRHGIPVIEDNAQAIGARYKGRMTGSMGTAGTLSFFPSKNLGAYGDGGAVTTRDEALYHKMRLVANHGSARRYHNEVVGVNSRLDAMQAAVLRVKLRYLEDYATARRLAADRYDRLLADHDAIITPPRANDRTHVFHQYTIRVTPDGLRDRLAAHLKDAGIPFGIYYPIPLHRLAVFTEGEARCRHDDQTETERAAREVISLPMHTELTEEQQVYICEQILACVDSGVSA